MKVPVCSSQKTTNTNNDTSTNPPDLCYEPTSVLDLHRSPSPVPAVAKLVSETDALELDDHVLQSFDWESIMSELDLSDDSSVLPQYNINISPFESHLQTDPIQIEFLDPSLDPNHDFASNFFDNYPLSSLELSGNINTWNYSGFEEIQELVRAADSVDSNDLQLCYAILVRLNQRLQSPTGKPLQRAAFYFKEALYSSLITGSIHNSISSWSEIVQTLKAYKTFSAISPIPMFTHFTINQALLETLHRSQPFIHIIDFDIGLGCHYASFMRELVHQTDSQMVITPPVLRITAIVNEDFATETKLIKESLSQFAHELKIRFHIDFVLTRTFELLSFKAIKFTGREKTAVLLSPTILHSVSNSTFMNTFVNDLRLMRPSVVVYVDSEGYKDSGTASFRRRFVNCIEFYSMMLESLDACVAGGEWVKRMEILLLRHRIFTAVEGCWRMVAQPWREVLRGGGFRAVEMSQFADFQADCLLRKIQVRGFHVAKRERELLLCWHQRPLVATSAWRFW